MRFSPLLVASVLALLQLHTNAVSLRGSPRPSEGLARAAASKVASDDELFGSSRAREAYREIAEMLIGGYDDHFIGETGTVLGVKAEESEKEKKERKFWNNYRLGDKVLYDKSPGCEVYPGTIICEYEKRTHEKHDIKTLAAIVKEHSATTALPSPNQVVLHVRLGDGLMGDHCWENHEDCRPRHADPPFYCFPKSYYENILGEIPPNSEIVVLGSPRHLRKTEGDEQAQSRVQDGNFTRDETYVDQLVQFFEEGGRSVTRRESSMNPDHDFVFMCYAKTLIEGGGGYSRLAAEVVESLGGKVILKQKLYPDIQPPLPL